MREDGPRLIGNVAIELDDGQVLAGFENHGGRTRLGPGARPLGRVLRGHGNDGRSGYEGVRGGPHGTVVGTYLHGPLLPKNAHFADWLTAMALGNPRIGAGSAGRRARVGGPRGGAPRGRTVSQAVAPGR